MNAIDADDETALPVFTYPAAVPAAIARQMAIPAVEPSSIFRRPTMSWKRAPMMAGIQPVIA
jgi:hypothetical protein